MIASKQALSRRCPSTASSYICRSLQAHMSHCYFAFVSSLHINEGSCRWATIATKYPVMLFSRRQAQMTVRAWFQPEMRVGRRSRNGRSGRCAPPQVSFRARVDGHGSVSVSLQYPTQSLVRPQTNYFCSKMQCGLLLQSLVR